MGYACALGTPVVGLRTDFRQAGDHDGVNVNLQVEECIHANGGILTDDPDAAVAHLATLLANA
jgi:nucleoside 2-deoxyribosyltransferase